MRRREFITLSVPVFSVIFATLRDSFRWPQKGTNFVLGLLRIFHK